MPNRYHRFAKGSFASSLSRVWTSTWRMPNRYHRFAKGVLPHLFTGTELPSGADPQSSFRSASNTSRSGPFLCASHQGVAAVTGPGLSAHRPPFTLNWGWRQRDRLPRRSAQGPRRAELLESWPNLLPHIVQAIMVLVRTSQVWWRQKESKPLWEMQFARLRREAFHKSPGR
jgi:hypothetical protein